MLIALSVLPWTLSPYLCLLLLWHRIPGEVVKSVELLIGLGAGDARGDDDVLAGWSPDAVVEVAGLAA